MTDYIVRMLSFDTPKQDMIQKALASAELQRLVFPATVYTLADDSVIVASFEQADAAFAVKPAETKPIQVKTLYAENGIELGFTFYFVGDNMPVVILLNFNSAHIADHTFNAQTFLLLIEQSLGNFSLDHATLYDREATVGRRRLTYFKGPKARAYPIQLGWATYFSPELVDFIGRAKLETLRDYSASPHTNGGITLTYNKDLSVFVYDPDFQADEANAIDQLGLLTL